MSELSPERRLHALALLAYSASLGKGRSKVEDRLEYLRAQIRAENISYGELAELQSLTDDIDPSDVELLEWAGVEEKS
jgi:hypothetical protein